jgi:hypothetical protein
MPDGGQRTGVVPQWLSVLGAVLTVTGLAHLLHSVGDGQLCGLAVNSEAYPVTTRGPSAYRCGQSLRGPSAYRCGQFLRGPSAYRCGQSLRGLSAYRCGQFPRGLSADVGTSFPVVLMLFIGADAACRQWKRCGAKPGGSCSTACINYQARM